MKVLKIKIGLLLGASLFSTGYVTAAFDQTYQQTVQQRDEFIKEILSNNELRNDEQLLLWFNGLSKEKKSLLIELDSSGILEHITHEEKFGGAAQVVAAVIGALGMLGIIAFSMYRDTNRDPLSSLDYFLIGISSIGLGGPGGYGWLKMIEQWKYPKKTYRRRLPKNLSK